MKTYLFDTLNRFRRFSENLDVKATLCNKPWQVFNDSGEKELYIFQEDGTLLITYSGRVTHSTWQYIAANKSIVISAGEQSYMVHPAFMDNVLFALQVDGTNECAFLIDENNAQSFAPRSYTALMGYFEEKERRALEEERRKRQAAIDAENRRRQAAIEEQRKKKLEEEQKRIKEEEEKVLDEHIRKLFFKYIEPNAYEYLFEEHPLATHLVSLLLSVLMELFVSKSYADTDLFVSVIFVFLWFTCFLGFFAGILPDVYAGLFRKRRLKLYVRKHSNDWEIPYLVAYYNYIVLFPWQKVRLN